MIIFDPVARVGDRMAWDRELAEYVAAWLHVMKGRIERQYDNIVLHDRDPDTEADRSKRSRLLMCIAHLTTLILRVDASWDAAAWEESWKWVQSVVRTGHGDPPSSDPPGDAVSDG